MVCDDVFAIGLDSSHINLAQIGYVQLNLGEEKRKFLDVGRKQPFLHTHFVEMFVFNMCTHLNGHQRYVDNVFVNFGQKCFQKWLSKALIQHKRTKNKKKNKQKRKETKNKLKKMLTNEINM